MKALCLAISAALLFPALATAQDCSDYRNHLRLVASVETPSLARGVAVSETHAYVTNDGVGLQVIDIADPENPWIAGSADTPGSRLRACNPTSRHGCPGSPRTGPGSCASEGRTSRIRSSG